MNTFRRGILGLGKESTSYYLNQIHYKFNLKNKVYSTCPLLLYQVDFQEVNPFLPDKFDILIPTLERYLNEVKNLGITKLLVPNITLHQTLDLIDTSIEICHPIHLTTQYLLNNKISRITVFGTIYTMNSCYLKEKFSQDNIDILAPSSEDQRRIDDFRKLVFKNRQTPNQISDFQNLIRKYAVENPVLISCTELSLYALRSSENCIDMADLQIIEFIN